MIIFVSLGCSSNSNLFVYSRFRSSKNFDKIEKIKLFFLFKRKNLNILRLITNKMITLFDINLIFNLYFLSFENYDLMNHKSKKERRKKYLHIYFDLFIN